ncbi:MAG: lysylphosphatidylglycerol synthase transmembrane domain-containing protein [Actinomycetota bacterium]
MGRLRRGYEALARRRWALVTIQLTAVGVLVFALGWAFRGAWHDARPRLRDADFSDLAVSIAILAAYYLLFTVGWQRMLRSWGLRIPYLVALQAEMASVLAKYVPGTVWIPAARVAALRRVGIRRTSLIVASMVMEAGLSALAGIVVFFISLTTVGFSSAPVLPLLVLALVVVVGLHPRIFTPGIRRVLRPFGASDLPPLPYSAMLGLLLYYSFTWLVGGSAIFFLLRSLGGEPSLTDIPYLGGIAAVSAIVAVLSLITPSGLGVREASMYGLLLAITSNGVALGVTVLNRLTITIVEAALLLLGAVAWRYLPRGEVTGSASRSTAN